MFAPEAFIAKLLVGPVPQAVDRGLDATDLLRVHGGGGRGEGVSDVSVEAAIAIGTGEASHGFHESNPLVCQLLAHFRNLTSTANDLCACSVVMDDFRA